MLGTQTPRHGLAPGLPAEWRPPSQGWLQGSCAGDCHARRAPTCRVGVSGMASSGCCAVATMAWYTAAPGLAGYDTGSLTASWLQASPICSACARTRDARQGGGPAHVTVVRGSALGQPAPFRRQAQTGAAPASLPSAAQQASHVQRQRHRSRAPGHPPNVPLRIAISCACRPTVVRLAAGRVCLPPHQLGAGIHLVGFKEQAGQDVPGCRGHRKHALLRRTEAACRQGGGQGAHSRVGSTAGEECVQAAAAQWPPPPPSPCCIAHACTWLLRIKEEGGDVAALQLLMARRRLQQHLHGTSMGGQWQACWRAGQGNAAHASMAWQALALMPPLG